jgi:hypothetical protein
MNTKEKKLENDKINNCVKKADINTSDRYLDKT